MDQLPQTIENGEGESITFLRIEEDHAEGPTLWLENMLQPSSGPPMHVHFQQEEALTVKTGKLAVQLDGEEVRFYGPGETAVFPAGTPHKFWAEGEVTTCDGYVRPPHNLQHFLTALYASTKKSGKGRPDDVESALLLERYGREYDMLEIPGFMRRFVFPILRTVGRLNGARARIETGPEPLPPA